MKMLKILLLTIVWFFAGTLSYAQSFFSAEILSSSPRYGSVKTLFVPEEIVTMLKGQTLNFDKWSSFFNIKSDPNAAAIRGTYRVENGQLLFSPSAKPDPSLRYFVTFSYPELSALIGDQIDNTGVYVDAVSFASPEDTQPTIKSVIPNLEIVPANLLRFYVYFSAPMGSEDPYSFISIKDSDGNKLKDPFVVTPGGLWNIDRTRLTLLLNPENPANQNNVIMESDVLLAGNEYTLNIDGAWKGASGKALKASFSREINASNPLRRPLNVNLWALKATQNQLCTLTVVTDHPLDQPLAKRMLYLRNKSGQILPSQVDFLNPETLTIVWRPEGSTELELHVDHRLEDVSGNTPLYAFDLDAASKVPPAEEIKLTFKLE